MKYLHIRSYKSLAFAICCGLSFIITENLSAEVSGPGWFAGKAAPVTHEESIEYLARRAISLESEQAQFEIAEPASDTAFQIKSATTATSLISDLAYSLQHDPKLIFDYVHNHIEYIPYFGSLKGATLTLLDGSGNDFDQAALLVALLREVEGCTAQFVYGEMSFPMDELSHWLGVANDPNIVGNVISSGGIPLQGNYANVFDRVWVKALIDGNEYVFDPAWKSYTDTAGIDIESAMGYERASFLTAAQNGATVTASSTQNLNEAAITS